MEYAGAVTRPFLRAIEWRPLRRLTIAIVGGVVLGMLVVVTIAVVLLITRHSIPDYWRPMFSP